MNLNVYLPNDLGRRAKEYGLPFSQMLRTAVEHELARLDHARARTDTAWPLAWGTCTDD